MNVRQRRKDMMDKARILIADDNPISRQVLASFLQINGYEIAEAADEEQTLSSFLVRPADVVLIDADMQAMAGWATCDRLRQRSQVPILIVSADSHPSVRGRALMWGANAFVSKPVNLQHLLDWIHIVAWRQDSNPFRGLPSLEASVQHSMSRSWGGLT
jgi:DNA-binding response OmpR family regulator